MTPTIIKAHGEGIGLINKISLIEGGTDPEDGGNNLSRNVGKYLRL